MEKRAQRSSRGQAHVETPHETAPSPWLQKKIRSKGCARNKATACKQDEEAPELEETSSWKQFPESEWGQGSSACKQEQETSELEALFKSPEPKPKAQEKTSAEREVRSGWRPPLKGTPGSEFPVVHVYNEFDEKSRRAQDHIRMGCEDERLKTRRRKRRLSGFCPFVDAS